MKTIVVAGACSKIGKTKLTIELCKILTGAIRIKIGHGEAKPGLTGFFYHYGTSFAKISALHNSARFLIIESNSILKEFTPDCTIYLPAERSKASAALAEAKADIKRGEPILFSEIIRLAGQLKCDKDTILKIVEVTGAIVR